jgi:hypothetical protein
VRSAQCGACACARVRQLLTTPCSVWGVFTAADAVSDAERHPNTSRCRGLRCVGVVAGAVCVPELLRKLWCADTVRRFVP